MSEIEVIYSKLIELYYIDKTQLPINLKGKIAAFLLKLDIEEPTALSVLETIIETNTKKPE